MWFYLTLLSVIALAAGELVQQHLLNSDKPFTPRTSSVLTFWFQSGVAFLLLLLFGQKGELLTVFEFNLVTKILLVTFLSSISMVLYLKSFRVKNISFSLIFGSFSAVVSTTLGIIFFNESAQSLKFLGIFMILLSIIALNYKNVNLERNHLFGLVAGIIFGILYTVDKSILQTVTPLIYIFYGFFLVGFFGLIVNPGEVIGSLRDKNFRDYQPLFISASCYFLYNFLTMSAYRLGGEVGKIDAINNSEIFLVILFEYFALQHAGSLKRKIITAVIAYVGVFILGLF
jgi:drug/metabolite transporter (DMT)-like permease